MGFGIWSLLYASILLTNSLAILSHERFLLPLGLSSASAINPMSSSASAANGFDSYGQQQQQQQFGNEEISVKLKIIQLVSVVRTFLRIPLIPINILVILLEALRV